MRPCGASFSSRAAESRTAPLSQGPRRLFLRATCPILHSLLRPCPCRAAHFRSTPSPPLSPPPPPSFPPIRLRFLLHAPLVMGLSPGARPSPAVAFLVAAPAVGGGVRACPWAGSRVSTVTAARSVSRSAVRGRATRRTPPTAAFVDPSAAGAAAAAASAAAAAAAGHLGLDLPAASLWYVRWRSAEWGGVERGMHWCDGHGRACAALMLWQASWQCQFCLYEEGCGFDTC